MIKAYAALSQKEELKPFTYQERELLPYEVELKVICCGVCHSDMHLIDNDWAISQYPLVPGHEIIGTIIKKGSLAEGNIGDRVGVSWARSSCLACDYCIEGDDNACASKTMTCNGNFGGFAEKVIADSRFVYPIPENLDSEHAAPLLCAGATVYTPLIRFKVQAPMRVGVIGIGGLGHLALQFAAAFGCQVAALSTNPSKQQEAFSFGAKEFILLNDVQKHVRSFDMILSTGPADLDWALFLSLLKPKGIFCQVGSTPKPLQIPSRLLIGGQYVIAGSSTAPRHILKEMLKFAADHGISPMIEVLPLDKCNEGLQRLRENKVRYRLVLKNPL